MKKYMIWHKKLGLMKICKNKLQVLLWQFKHGKDEQIEVWELK